MPKPSRQLRAQMSQAAQRRAQAHAHALLAEDGWSLWAYESPYDYTQVELMRPAWPAPQRCNPWTLHPLTNVCDLYWRPLRHDEDDAHA
jgi:hypothetical protein